jgi:hypothetical protein
VDFYRLLIMNLCCEFVNLCCEVVNSLTCVVKLSICELVFLLCYCDATLGACVEFLVPTKAG